ncbi:glycosyltransferase family 39 protein [bacterium]|nr:glycosyltransferase family 39 protein [bacterium]
MHPGIAPPVVNRCAPAVRRVEVVATAPRPFPATLVATLLILGWVALGLAYLGWFCPLDLSPDEAHYWHWSRRLDWSYYSKGPLVAWLIRGSCELFGTSAFAVRVPAVLSSAALLAAVFVLARDALRDGRAAVAVVAVAMTLPPVTAASVLMTIDPPFLACWAWALVGVMRGVERRAPRWWLVAGVCSGLGVLAKYPMLLLPAAVLGFLLARRRDELRRPGIWLFLALTALGLLPIVVWNAAHDWVSLRHTLGQSGVGDGVKPRPVEWRNPLGFVATQAGVLLGTGFAAFAAAGYAFRRAADPRLSLLWWAAVPVWGLFLAASLRNPGQPNWPAAAYVGGLVLAAAWVRGRGLRRVVVGTAVVGLVGSVSLRFPAVWLPVLVQLTAAPTETNPTPVRRLDATARLRGWRTLAAEVDRVRERVERETGRDPVLAATRWTTPGELSFYCRGRPEAYSFGPALEDRSSQYDLWRPNPTADAQAFRGRTFIYVGEAIPAADRVFDRVEAPFRVVHAEQGIPVSVWTVWVMHGFRGFPEGYRLTRPTY